MSISRHMFIGCVGLISAISLVVISKNRTSETLIEKNKKDEDRYRKLTEEIIELNREHLEVLDRNGNDPKSTEAVQFRQRLTPVLIEYRILQNQHPEWEGKPIMATRSQ